MRRSTRIGGLVVGIGAGIAGAVWLVRDRLTRNGRNSGEAAAAPRFRVAPASAPRPEPGDDDLSQVKGIGPVYRARLAAAGLTPFVGLAAADPEQVAAAAQVGIDQANGWIEQAVALAGAHHAGKATMEET